MDPSLEAYDSQFHGQCYETLTYYDYKTGELQPVLATEWSSSEGGKTWTFKIREGVKFHDGTDVDAAAVKFSIERTRDLGQGGGYLWAGIKTIDTPDEHTAVFHLAAPQPLDLMLASSIGAFIMSPAAVQAHDEEWLLSNEAGSGPYRVKSVTDGQEVVMQRFDDYWRGWSGDHFDGVILRFVSEGASRRQLLETGELGIALQLSLEDREALADNPDVEMVQTPSWVDLGFRFNTLKEPLSNPLVRKALVHSVPYDTIIEGVLGGLGERTYGPLVPGLWGYEEQMAMLDATAELKYDYDIERARALLKEAGYPDGGFELEAVYYGGHLPSEMTCQFWKESLSELNIGLKTRALPTGSMAPTLEKKEQDVMVSNWWPAYPDPYDNLFNQLHTQESGIYNASYYSNESFDKMIDEAYAVSTEDRAKAAEMYAEAIKTELQDAPMATLFVEYSVPFISKNVVASWEGVNPAYPKDVRAYWVVPRE